MVWPGTFGEAPVETGADVAAGATVVAVAQAETAMTNTIIDVMMIINLYFRHR